MRIFKFKNIWQKISFFLWGTIIITLLVFSLIFIPFTNTIFEEKLTSEAENIIAAINPSLNSSIVIDDYSDFLDFTLSLLPQNRYYEYLIVHKKDGFSIIITQNNWKIDSLKQHWTGAENLANSGMMMNNEFSEDRVFNYSSKIEFPGIDWGVIHVGLNLNEYNENKNKIITFASLLGLASGFITLFFAILFGKRLTRPIYELNVAALEVSKGDFKVKCDIKTGDEIEQLADTFNHMTQEIYNSHTQLEEKVRARTQNLREINETLNNEIDFRKQAESLVKESLEEKTTLLQEIHHRVKNNLQIISSLLFLQITKSNDSTVNQLLLDSQNRVRSMALVHEKLYKSTNLAEIEFDEYIIEISNYIYSSYNKDSIQMIYDLEKRYLSINSAVPCGLIINELISNVMKYAFPDKTITNPEMIISLKLIDNNYYRLSIKDNGIGMPVDLDVDALESLGLKLVQNLVNQLDGKLEIINSEGTEFVITFKETENTEQL